MKKYAIVAGGTGTRMNSVTPLQQFMLAAWKPVLYTRFAPSSTPTPIWGDPGNSG